MAQRGAPKGNQNRKGKLLTLSKDVAERIAAAGCDPFMEMIEIARECKERGTTQDLQIAAMLHKELAQYCAPKHRAIEHTGTIDVNATVTTIRNVIIDSQVVSHET